MKEKAIYIGAVVLTAVWGVAAPGGFAPFLLGFELLLAFSMWILVQILAGRVEIVPEPGEETVGKQEPIVLRVKLKNASLLPASCVAVTVGWRDLLDNSTGTVESMGMAGGKRTGVLEFCIPVRYSGVYEFWIPSASVRDWFRLWSKKLLTTDKKVQVLSVPLVHQAEEWIPPAQLASGGDSDQHSQKKGGDDGSEVFEVRAYRDGDPLQRVHWKLTAKTGEMLVREFSLPKREVLLLQVDLYHPPQEKWDHCKLERLLEQTADFCWRLLAAEQEYEVFWQEQEQLCRMQISRAPELWVFLKRLCLTATKEELEQNGKQSQKQSAGKNKYPAEGSLERSRGSGVTEPGADGQLWKIDAEGTVRQVRGNEERAGAGTAGEGSGRQDHLSDATGRRTRRYAGQKAVAAGWYADLFALPHRWSLQRISQWLWNPIFGPCFLDASDCLGAVLDRVFQTAPGRGVSAPCDFGNSDRRKPFAVVAAKGCDRRVYVRCKRGTHSVK